MRMSSEKLARNLADPVRQVTDVRIGRVEWKKHVKTLAPSVPFVWTVTAVGAPERLEHAALPFFQ